MENYIFVFDSTEITVLPCLFDFFFFLFFKRPRSFHGIL